MAYNARTQKQKLGFIFTKAAGAMLAERQLLATELAGLTPTGKNSVVTLQDIEKACPTTPTEAARHVPAVEVLSRVKRDLISAVELLSVEMNKIDKKQLSLVYKVSVAAVDYIVERRSEAKDLSVTLDARAVVDWIKQHLTREWTPSVKSQINIAVHNAFMIADEHKGIYFDHEHKCIAIPNNRLNPIIPMMTLNEKGKPVTIKDTDGKVKMVKNTDATPVRLVQSQQRTLWNGAHGINPKSSTVPAKREGQSGQGDASVNITAMLKGLSPASGLAATAKFMQQLRDDKVKLTDKSSGYVIDILQALHEITNQANNKDWIDENGWYVAQDEGSVKIAAE